ncbi:MAG: spermidine/putrescine ABC transporter substrate-binding protein [Candidatus Nanopelagicales bacterium]|nr:spermidine/putrescine ABC transporter substrate-binding protein [Candidatus Nanopelagicales bacterium]
MVEKDPRTEFLKAAMSRRGFLSSMGAAGTAAFLAACGTRGGTGNNLQANSGGGDSKTIVWANWTLYLDYDEESRTYPTLVQFEEETGYTVEYREDIDDNVSFNGKLAPQLSNGQNIGYDLVTPTDWLAAEWIRKGYVGTIDEVTVPNKVNILPALEDVSFDPGREYSLTWQSGFGGLAWNKERIPNGLTSVNDLWAPELKGKVVVLSEMRDTIGLIMLSQGVDISESFTDEQFMAALDVLQQQVDSGQVKQVKGNSYKEDLINEQAWAAIGWSGDIFQINAEEGDKWEFALPDTGGTLWSDNLMVPITASNPTGAHALMDYYYRPDVAAEVAAYVNYVCPVQGAQEEMQKIDPALAESEWIFPTEEILQNAYVFRALTPEEQVQYTDAFGRVIQG